jgi:tRNA pseudouridine38-40 synthase
MRRIAIRLEYDGTDFCGWQLQAADRTVQQVVESAAARATGAAARVPVQGASRTDSGVHALGQAAHFDTDSALDCAVLVRALNHWLPPDAAVLDACDAAPDFHARFSAERKLYRYRLLRGRVRRPLRERFCVREGGRLDLAAMRRCADLTAGAHDFAAFTTEKQPGQNTVRTIGRSEWLEADDELHYEIEGQGFLYNMVRALVGTMLLVGRGKLAVEQFAAALEARDRRAGGPTSPARGLTLVDVRYGPQWELPWEEG